MEPFGYIPPGPLFGWRQFPNVNNPFWMKDSAPHFMDPMDRKRTIFANHAWIEFSPQRGRRRVLDVTHGRQNSSVGYVISEGQQNRQDYLAVSTELGDLDIIQDKPIECKSNSLTFNKNNY